MSTPRESQADASKSSGSRAHLKERAREELRNYLLVALYLYICFSIALIYKSALLEQEGVQFLPHGLAAIKALILGKFVLIGKAIGVGSRVRVSTLAMAIAVRSIAGSARAGYASCCSRTRPAAARSSIFRWLRREFRANGL